jgi:hypothetical protein
MRTTQLPELPKVFGTANFPAMPFPHGLWLQVYLGSMTKNAQGLPNVSQIERDLIGRALDLGMSGVLFHGGVRHFERHHQRYVDLAKHSGIRFGFAYGVDGTRDTDGTKLTTQEKGAIIGSLASSIPTMSMSVVNAEIQYDSDAGPEDDMDEAGAMAMGAQVRARAPDALIFDQPWFAIDQHGEARRQERPIDAGGPFAGFPSDEFASWINVRAPQVYYRNFGASNPLAYRRVVSWHEKEWAEHDTLLEKHGLKRPRTYTLQMYGHHKRPQDFVHALVTLRDRPVIGWWDHEYFRKSDQWRITCACVAAVKQIVDGGHAPPGRSARECIRSWQQALGLKDAQLDGACGFGTLKAAGLYG